MPTFDSDGVEIAYDITGDGEPIVLIHGFASNRQVNWHETGWVSHLAREGRMVITLDNRGHGDSEKLYDPEVYSSSAMAADAARLITHLGMPQSDVMGYSMGARITALLAINHGELIRSAVIAGLGQHMITGLGGSEDIAEGLEAHSLADVVAPVPRAFRIFAEATDGDLRALAACMRSSRQKITEADLGTITCPVLVAVGTDDEIAGPLEPLAEAIPGAQALPIPDRDHMRSVGDKVYKAGVSTFLGGIA